MSSTSMTQPASHRRPQAGPDDLAEGALSGRRVVEHLDDLDVTLVGERRDDIAVPARVDSPSTGPDPVFRRGARPWPQPVLLGR